MEPFSRQLKRASLIGLIGAPSLIALDSFAAGHRLHEAHLLPVDISVFVVAALLACWLVPPRLGKSQR